MDTRSPPGAGCCAETESCFFLFFVQPTSSGAPTACYLSHRFVPILNSISSGLPGIQTIKCMELHVDFGTNVGVKLHVTVFKRQKSGDTKQTRGFSE